MRNRFFHDRISKQVFLQMGSFKHKGTENLQRGTRTQDVEIQFAMADWLLPGWNLGQIEIVASCTMHLRLLNNDPDREHHH